MSVADSPAVPFIYLLAQSKNPPSSPSEAIATCLENLVESLAAAGCDLDDVVKVTTYLPHELMTVEGYAEYNRIYRPFFNAHGIFRLPARGSVGVVTPTGCEVQMEALALTPADSAGKQ